MPVIEIPDKQMVVEFPDTMSFPDIEKAILADVYGKQGAAPSDMITDVPETKPQSKYKPSDFSPAISTITGKPVDDKKFEFIRTFQPVPALAAAGIVESAAGVSGMVGADETAKRLRADANAVRNYVEKEYPQKRGSWPAAIRNAFVSIYTQAPAMAIGLLTGGSTVPLTMMGAQAGTQKTSELEGAGVSKPKAIALGTVSGVAEALTEKLPFDSFLKIMKVNKSAGKDIVNFFVGEQLGEQAATAVDYAIDQVKPGEKWDWNEYLTRIEETAKATAVQAGTMGAVAGAFGKPMNLKTEQETPLPEAQTTPQHVSKPTGLPISDLHKAIAREAITETLAKNGMTPETFLQTISLGREPIQNVLPKPADTSSAVSSQTVPGQDLISKGMANRQRQINKIYEAKAEKEANIKKFQDQLEEVSREKEPTIIPDDDKAALDLMSFEIRNTSGAERGSLGGDTAHGIGSSSPEWFQKLNSLVNFESIGKKKDGSTGPIKHSGISRDTFTAIANKIKTNGYDSLTEIQKRYYFFIEQMIPEYKAQSEDFRAADELSFMQENGYEPLAGKEVVVGDLDEGDKVLIKGEEFENTGMNADGTVTLKDGMPITLEVFDKIRIDGIKKAPATEAPEELRKQIEAAAIKAGGRLDPGYARDRGTFSVTDLRVPGKEQSWEVKTPEDVVAKFAARKMPEAKPAKPTATSVPKPTSPDAATSTETLPSGVTVDWSKEKVIEKDGLKGTYYATYNKDGSFKSWYTKTEIERLKNLKGVEGLNLKQDNYGSQTPVKGKPTKGEQAGLGLVVEDPNQPEMFKKSGLSKLAESEAVKEQKGEVGLDINQEPEAKTSFAPEIEEAYQSAKGVKQEGIVSKIKEIATEISNKFTRTYESLAETGENSQLIFDLKKLEKQKEVAADKTVRTVGEVLSELNPNEYDVFSRKLFLDDLYDDLKRELYQDKDMPFNFTEKSLIAEKKKIDSLANANPKVLDAIKKRKEAWEQVKSEYVSALKPYKEGVEDMFRENYYRHQVLDYVTNQGIFGTGKRIKAPVNKGYTKGRKGVSNLYNTDFFEAEHNIMAQMLYDIEVAKTLTKIKKIEDISDKLKAEAKKQDIKDWRSLIPEGYVEWQPREGQVFYPVMSVNEKLAEKLATDQIGNLVGAEIAAQLKEVLAVGGKRKQWIVREEVADTLNNLVKDRGEGIISQADLQIMSSWKKWQLISPRRAFKYNLRNLSGDSEATFLGNPAGFKKIGQATKELYEVFYGKKPMSHAMEEWFNRGGMGSTLQAQEMDQVKKLWIFKRLYKKDADINIIKKAWDTVRLATDFRESILRYANFLSFKEQLAKNGKVTNYGASNPEMIDALSDPDDKAFWLSNDLLGAYDKVSVAGQTIRERMIPFYSFQEINFKRYIRLFKNAVNDGKLTSAIGKKLGAKGLLTAMRIGRFALKAAAFAAMLQAWNYLFFRKEEEELPRDVRTRTHIILGKDKDGNINYFNRLGTLDDFVSWFGLDFIPKNTIDLMNGRQTWQEAAKAQATKTYQAPINKVVQGSAPFMKLAGELITRRSTFPDTFKPGTVRDRGLHVARSVGLENEYIAMTGKPSKGYGGSLKNLFVYRIDPGEAAYRNTIDLKMSFMKKQGKVSEGFWLTPSGDILYNMKLAVRYNDKEAFGKYLKEYIALNQGKSLNDIAKKASDGIKRMHPLNGLSANEQAAFIATLNKEDKKTIEKALNFYHDVLNKMGTQEKKP